MNIFQNEIFKNPLFYVIVSITVVLICLLILIILLNKSKKRKSKQSIDEDFINTVIQNLGGSLNIVNVEVINERIKFILNDVKKANANVLNEISTKGVSLSGKTLTMLFKYESSKIKKEIDKIIK